MDDRPKTPLRDMGVEAQYASPTSLNARIALHAGFSTAQTTWSEWLLARLAFAPNSSVLEVGCGPGSFWKACHAGVPRSIALTVSDRSDGMVDAARGDLTSLLPPQTRFITADVTNLPFADASFDLVIANHMLYLVPDLDRAVSELARVISRDGRLVAATNGSKHLLEMTELAQRHTSGTIFDGGYDTSNFSLETGMAVLQPHFATVERSDFPDGLAVTEAAPVLDYVASMPSWNLGADFTAMEHELTAIIRERGAFLVTKASGLFIGSDPVSR